MGRVHLQPIRIEQHAHVAQTEISHVREVHRVGPARQDAGVTAVREPVGGRDAAGERLRHRCGKAAPDSLPDAQWLLRSRRRDCVALTAGRCQQADQSQQDQPKRSGRLHVSRVEAISRITGRMMWRATRTRHPCFSAPNRYRGRSDAPIRTSSTARAACRPSRIAQTTSDWPRRMSPAAKTLGIEVA